MHAVDWGNIGLIIVEPINTTQELANDSSGSQFLDIADVGDGNWNRLALLTVILLKAPPKHTRRPISQLLTLDRLNVWFSKRCYIIEPRTTHDIEEAWQWIQTDHTHWTNYYLGDPPQADKLLEEVQKVLRADLDQQIRPPLDPATMKHLIVEYLYGEAERIGLLGIALRPGTTPAVFQKLVEMLLDFHESSYITLLQRSKLHPIVERCLGDNNKTISNYLGKPRDSRLENGLEDEQSEEEHFED